MPIQPLPALDRTSPTFRPAVDTFFATQLPTFSVEAEAARAQINSNTVTATDAAATATAQAVIATTKANAAAASAISAQGSADDAATQATAVATASKISLGSKTSDPATDNQGGALLIGAWYYNTVSAKIRVYTGSGWVEGIAAVAGVTSVNTKTGDVLLKTINSAALDGAADIALPTFGANTFVKAQRGAFVTLTDAATVAIDLSLANQFNLVLAGNRTLGVPSNAVAGQQGIINIYQDPTGTRTLAYSWLYAWPGGTAMALSTTKCSRDMLAYSVDAYNSGGVTMTIAAPGVATMAAHGFISGHKCQLTTTGALPTGLVANTTYYLRVIDADTFHFCTSLANVAANTRITTSGSQSGVHTLTGGVIALNLARAVI